MSFLPRLLTSDPTAFDSSSRPRATATPPAPCWPSATSCGRSTLTMKTGRGDRSRTSRRSPSAGSPCCPIPNLESRISPPQIPNPQSPIPTRYSSSSSPRWALERAITRTTRLCLAALQIIDLTDAVRARCRHRLGPARHRGGSPRRGACARHRQRPTRLGRRAKTSLSTPTSVTLPSRWLTWRPRRCRPPTS